MAHNLFNSLQDFTIGAKKGKYYSLAALEKAGVGKVSRLPVSVRIVLESVLRNCDGIKVTEEHVRQLANWKPNAPRTDEIPFVVARVVLQDFTGVPLLADLAAMRNVAADMGRDPKLIEPLVPVDLVVDHSIEVDVYNSKDALRRNMEIEFQRNGERYTFLKWGKQAFSGIRIVPPGNGMRTFAEVTRDGLPVLLAAWLVAWTGGGLFVWCQRSFWVMVPSWNGARPVRRK